MMRFEIKRYGRPNADTLLFQMVDEHDLEVIEQEVSYIRELSGGQDFCLTAVKVNDWNKDLSPWPAPAVFGSLSAATLSPDYSRSGPDIRRIGLTGLQPPRHPYGSRALQITCAKTRFVRMRSI